MSSIAVTAPRQTPAVVDGRPAVQVPAHMLYPGVDVHVDGAWRHLYSASTSSHYGTTTIIWEGPGIYTDRRRHTPADHTYTVAVPDVAGFPADTPVLLRLDAYFARGYVTSPAMNGEERDAAVRYIADASGIGAGPTWQPCRTPEWIHRHYAVQDSYDIANAYVHSRRMAAALRAIAALAG